jgi:hypothetical protein
MFTIGEVRLSFLGTLVKWLSRLPVSQLSPVRIWYVSLLLTESSHSVHKRMTTLYKPTETMTAVDAILEIYTEEELFDIAYHGCASGCASSHIYTSDCVKFFDEYECEITDYIEENLGMSQCLS